MYSKASEKQLEDKNYNKLYHECLRIFGDSRVKLIDEDYIIIDNLDIYIKMSLSYNEEKIYCNFQDGTLTEFFKKLSKKDQIIYQDIHHNLFMKQQKRKVKFLSVVEAIKFLETIEIPMHYINQNQC